MSRQTWLRDAVFYEIYPQSFADSDGDGIGDFPGVLARLDHLAWLGVTAIWFNPCFASPFRDAGYDVSDYLRVAPRYGTNEDLVAVVDAARERGIRVVLDLVAGHTSVDHEWFRSAVAGDGLDRYIWATGPQADAAARAGTDRPAGDPTGQQLVRVGDGRYYLKNFYDEQPALNFGYARTSPSEPWRQPVDAPGPRRNRAALREIMDIWLARGVAGFRVDMAFSLVKDDAGFVETTRIWRELTDWLHAEHPEAILVPEGFEPATPGRPAFDADFCLVIDPAHGSLFDNGGAGSLPWVPPGACYFDAAAQGSPRRFLDLWSRRQDEMGPGRMFLLASADHDYSRLAMGSRTAGQLGVAWAFLMTWDCVPSVYYGDEIGMRYVPGLPDVEGSRIVASYNRAGCRTPMQWDGSPGAGFSTADPDSFYLPLDPAPDRPSVAAALADPGSVLHLVRRLVALRRSVPALAAGAPTDVLADGYPWVYVRGAGEGGVLVALNPGAAPVTCDLPERHTGPWAALEASGCVAGPDRLALEPFGFGVFERGS